MSVKSMQVLFWYLEDIFGFKMAANMAAGIIFVFIIGTNHHVIPLEVGFNIDEQNFLHQILILMNSFYFNTKYVFMLVESILMLLSRSF